MWDVGVTAGTQEGKGLRYWGGDRQRTREPASPASHCDPGLPRRRPRCPQTRAARPSHASHRVGPGPPAPPSPAPRRPAWRARSPGEPSAIPGRPAAAAAAAAADGTPATRPRNPPPEPARAAQGGGPARRMRHGCAALPPPVPARRGGVRGCEARFHNFIKQFESPSVVKNPEVPEPRPPPAPAGLGPRSQELCFCRFQKRLTSLCPAGVTTMSRLAEFSNTSTPSSRAWANSSSKSTCDRNWLYRTPGVRREGAVGRDKART